MKLFRTLLKGVAAVAALCLSVSISSAGITDTVGTTKAPHDFSQNGQGAWSGNQICQPCHTPHNATVKDANGADVQAPLWNHALPTNSYTMYVDGKLKTGAQLDQNSILCMSCHDGTLALDSFGGKTGTQKIGPAGFLGTDLSDDHPMGEGAKWPQTFDPTANDGAGAWVGGTYMVTPDLRDKAGIMPLKSMSDGTLVVGCTSCHEPHNRKKTEHLLWISNSGAGTTVDGRAIGGSLLCMNCHKK